MTKVANKSKKANSSKTSPARQSPAAPVAPEVAAERLLSELRGLITQARARVAQAVNAGQVLLNWHIGQSIRSEILGEQRAEYGERIVATLAQQLTAEYGRGYGRRNLFNMMRFAEVFPDLEIVQTLSAQLSWSHFVELVYQKDALKRDFYAELCRLERWDVRTLRRKINGLMFERTALAKKPEDLIAKELAELRETGQMTPDLVFRDPYFLDFLGLPAEYSEKDLENAILRELEKFLLEIGTDFTFVARQKRLTIDGDDFHLDLLFYHRGLRRLVAFELKLGKFTAADSGQTELYLRWLNKYERRPGEESPLGIVLCSEKGTEQVELLELHSRGIRVAEYMTELPPRALLESKLHEAIRLARARLEAAAQE